MHFLLDKFDFHCHVGLLEGKGRSSRIWREQTEVSKSILVNADNQGAIKLAKNPAFHKRSKHIDVKYHFIRSEVQQSAVSIRYIASEDNLADIFTKPVSRVRLDKFKPLICN